MRFQSAFLFLMPALLATACGRSDPNHFTLAYDEVGRVEECHLLVNRWSPQYADSHAGVRFVCGVQESAQKEKEWWGDKPQPLLFGMGVGECLLLGEKFYCLERVESDSVTFRATYQWATRHHDHIKPLPAK